MQSLTKATVLGLADLRDPQEARRERRGESRTATPPAPGAHEPTAESAAAPEAGDAARG